MGGSLVERLILPAGLCESFSAFYDAAAGEIGIIGAEQAALAEFGNLKALYGAAPEEHQFRRGHRRSPGFPFYDNRGR